MKKIYVCIIAWVLLSLGGYSQNLAINSDGSLANPNAILDIKSFNKGVLFPRMSTAARTAIPNTRGLLVYDTTTNSFWYNTGTAWMNMSAVVLATGNEWLLTGNAGTVDGANFIGTTDNVPLNIRVNNLASGRIDPNKNNVFWGYRAGSSNTTGTSNTGVGSYALRNTTTGRNNTALGYNALFANSTGMENTSIGSQSMTSNTSGNNNTAIGRRSLNANTGGHRNTAMGFQSMYLNITGSDNTSSGVNSMQSNTTGNLNTATGVEALFSNIGGSNNTATGVNSLRYNTHGYFNTATGFAALYENLSGFNNTADGTGALQSNKTGSSNTAIGVAALSLNSSGGENTASGFYSLFNNTGARNTAMGVNALISNTGGSNNTAIGFFADVSIGDLTNATAIGNGALVNASNKVRIGNAAVTVIEGQVPFTTPSDGRFKFAVKEDVKGLDFILQLRPITYQFNVKRFDAQFSKQNNESVNGIYDEALNMRRSGFIAQEVEKAAITSGYNFSGIIKPKTEWTYRYSRHNR